MKANTPEEFILKLQEEYNRLITRYHDPSERSNRSIIEKLLRDDLRAILQLRKEA